MNDTKPESAVEQPAKVEPQTAEPKPVKVIAPKAPKVAKTSAAKSSKAKAATTKGKTAKAPAKAKGKAATKTAKPAKAKVSKPAKQAKAIPQGKFPRHPKNVFRPGSAYGAIYDGFILRRAGIRRDELLKLAMEATGKDAKHASYDLAVILSAKDSPTGPRHPSCREGFWVSRENDHLRLNID